MLAVVAKILPWSQSGELSHHPISFDNNDICILLPNNPLSPLHGYWNAGSVADRDEINKRVGPILRSDEIGHVEHVVHGDFQARQIFEFWDHRFENEKWRPEKRNHWHAVKHVEPAQGGVSIRACEIFHKIALPLPLLRRILRTAPTLRPLKEPWNCQPN